MGGGQAGATAGGSYGLGRPEQQRPELYLVADSRPARAPRALRAALRGLAQLTRAEPLSLSSIPSASWGCASLRTCFPRPADPSSTPLAWAPGAQANSCGASFARPGRATAHATASSGQQPCSGSPSLSDHSLAPARLSRQPR